MGVSYTESSFFKRKMLTLDFRTDFKHFKMLSFYLQSNYYIENTKKKKTISFSSIKTCLPGYLKLDLFELTLCNCFYFCKWSHTHNYNVCINNTAWPLIGVYERVATENSISFACHAYKFGRFPCLAEDKLCENWNALFIPVETRKTF